ncbi:serine/threonine-protein kinase [Nonomuraea sp. SYSU D8015]|uniref:serine/threonine-protein kinase n=1 Tax=Nonomuraea sp. SYSU D8015 TaxID=2593644 RepID=UPI001660D187|nr:serine/threonine-protein kinase [Nonomuraea sp. SYSU D8015]
MLGAGTTLNDRYVLTGRLGGGGMGEVWRADDTVLGRAVAVKVLMPALTEDPTLAQRFLNEARAMATLHHPGVVDVYDYGTCEAGGRRLSFLVMEYIRGESLDRVLRRGPLGPAATMRLIAEVGDALAAAHAQGIVHRDVKPANLMVRPEGGVVLTDFGIAHSVSAGHLTATGTMLCSAGYCAPELATASEVTPAVDVYALGVVAYECLTGELPFQGNTPVQIIFKHLNSPIPPLPAEVPPGPRHVVERALEKAPDRRWPTVADMAEAARRATTSPSTVPMPAPRRRRTTRAVLTMAAAVLVSAGVAGSVWLRPAEPTMGTTVTPTVEATSATVDSPTPPTTSRPPSAPPSRRLPSAKPTRATPSPSPTVTTTPTTPTTTPTVTPTTSEPTKEPTQEPEPSSPGPEEPTSEPSAGTPPSDIQCVREPCP